MEPHIVLYKLLFLQKLIPIIIIIREMLLLKTSFHIGMALVALVVVVILHISVGVHSVAQQHVQPQHLEVVHGLHHAWLVPVGMALAVHSVRPLDTIVNASGLQLGLHHVWLVPDVLDGHPGPIPLAVHVL